MIESLNYPACHGHAYQPSLVILCSMCSGNRTNSIHTSPGTAFSPITITFICLSETILMSLRWSQKNVKPLPRSTETYKWVHIMLALRHASTQACVHTLQCEACVWRALWSRRLVSLVTVARDSSCQGKPETRVRRVRILVFLWPPSWGGHMRRSFTLAIAQGQDDL